MKFYVRIKIDLFDINLIIVIFKQSMDACVFKHNKYLLMTIKPNKTSIYFIYFFLSYDGNAFVGSKFINSWLSISVCFSSEHRNSFNAIWIHCCFKCSSSTHKHTHNSKHKLSTSEWCGVWSPGMPYNTKTTVEQNISSIVQIDTQTHTFGEPLSPRWLLDIKSMWFNV